MNRLLEIAGNQFKDFCDEKATTLDFYTTSNIKDATVTIDFKDVPVDLDITDFIDKIHCVNIVQSLCFICIDLPFGTNNKIKIINIPSFITEVLFLSRRQGIESCIDLLTKKNYGDYCTKRRSVDTTTN